MMEVREYTYSEMSELLGTYKNTNIKHKLDRYGIEYECTGRGRAIVYDIKCIPNPFKLFCILEWEFPSQTNFEKLRNFLYYYWCDEGFALLPMEEMANRLSDSTAPVSRQTISRWIDRMRQLDLISLSSTEYIYYKVRRNKVDGKRIQEYISREQYRAGWGIYWKSKKEHNDSQMAFMEMYYAMGGVPKKSPVVEVNGITYHSKVEPVLNMIQEDILNGIFVVKGE